MISSSIHPFTVRSVESAAHEQHNCDVCCIVCCLTPRELPYPAGCVVLGVTTHCCCCIHIEGAQEVIFGGGVCMCKDYNKRFSILLFGVLLRTGFGNRICGCGSNIFCAVILEVCTRSHMPR